MTPERLRQIFEKHGVDKLIEFILRKDDMINCLEKRLEGLEYLGTLNIKDENYSFYIKENT